MSSVSLLDHGRGGGGARLLIDDNRSSHVQFNNMPISAIVDPGVFSHSLAKSSIFSSPGLSLSLQTNLEASPTMAEAFEHNLGRSREELEHESRSGSDNMVGASGDEQDATGDKPRRKKRYHRHTPQQIQELELVFKECPHPDEKQRLELSRRLCLETRQVKFWFQNRRTQMKTQLERHENTLLRQENDKLRSENLSIREAMRNPICTNCGGHAMITEISLEEQQLRIENARLKDELDRVFLLAGKFLGRPVATPLSGSNLELGVGMNGFGGLPVPASMTLPPEFTIGISDNSHSSVERSMFLELALGAMDELVKIAQIDDPLWTRNSKMGREILNQEEYMKILSPCIGLKSNGFAREASRETGLVMIDTIALVETLMDSKRLAEMFPCLIARMSTTDVISSGVGGTRNGALQLMHGEFQVLSPLVPIRSVSFLRFCKQHAEGVWAVVDVSIDTMKEANSRRLPSGCVIQDMLNGFSKVTWVEHAEYDESQVHHLYRPLLSSGIGFGARRWVATLLRQCQCLAILVSSSLQPPNHSAITPAGHRSMLKLAGRMTENFCAGVCGSTAHEWNKLNAGNVDENVRVMTRQSINDPGEPSGIVLSAATSVWLPVSLERLFDFLRDERLRSEWDILSNGGPMQEMTRIAKGQDRRNCVSLLRASATNANQSSMLILQETYMDVAGSLVVYAPVDIPAMQIVMNGGDSTYVALLPSGFSAVPDGRGLIGPVETINDGKSGEGNDDSRLLNGGGCLLTVAFQILVNNLPTAKLTVESVETVNNLISCTVQKIKVALQCDKVGALDPSF